jgi:hypothetical protein
MRLNFRQLWPAIALLAVTVLPGVAQDAAKDPVNVAGRWTVSVQGRRGTRTQELTIQQTGSEISGTLVGNRSNAFQGTLEGNKIQFTVNMETRRGSITLTYSGAVQGDSMKGTIETPRGNGKWSAVRESE